MKKIIFIYGVTAYLIAFVGQLVFTLYVGGFNILGRSINDNQTVDTLAAIIINIALTIFFGIQHSVMARSWLKNITTKIIPQASERSTYTLFSGIALIIVTLYWQPINGFIWNFNSGIAYYIMLALFIFGWTFSLVSTFVINHFELFGLQQVYNNLKNIEEKESQFSERLFYKFIRHPIQLGVIIGLFFAPTMSYSHLLLALLFTIYIFIGLYLEEKTLEKDLGETYKDYKKRVGMLIPKL